MNVKKIFTMSLTTAIIVTALNFSVASADTDLTKSKSEKLESKHTIVLNKKDPENKKYEANKLLFMTSQDDNGTLLFSDSPETVEEDGILFQDAVKGNGRLLYYHLNGTQEDKKIAVIAENLSNEDNQITMTRKAVSGPSDDYLYVGKTGLKRYFDNQQEEILTIPAKGKTLFYAPDGERIVPSGGLVYGVFDFNAKENVKLTVIMAPKDENLIKFADKASVQQKDAQRLRGKYQGKDRCLTNRNPYNPQKSGSAYFYVGDNKTDLYKYGYDKTDNSITQNFGNYGIVYTINPKLAGEGKTSFYLKPLGGVYSGAICVKVGKDGQSKMIETPDTLPFFGHEAKYNYYAYLGTYNNSDDVYFEYTPPGASNLPVEIILIPEK